MYTRSHCNYTLPHLEKTVGPALDSVSMDLMRKYLKVRDYMKPYSEVLEHGDQVGTAVYKRLATNLTQGYLSA